MPSPPPPLLYVHDDLTDDIDRRFGVDSRSSALLRSLFADGRGAPTEQAAEPGGLSPARELTAEARCGMVGAWGGVRVWPITSGGRRPPGRRRRVLMLPTLMSK